MEIHVFVFLLDSEYGTVLPYAGRFIAMRAEEEYTDAPLW
jgi:hypothetical protein